MTRAKIAGVDLVYEIVDPQRDKIRAAYKPGATVKQLAEGHDLAINFNFSNNDIGQPIGRLIIDGKAVIGDSTKTKPRDELYMLADGSLHISKAPTAAVWAVQGSPRLLKDGKRYSAESIKRDQTGSDIWQNTNTRSAAGIRADGQLIVVRTISAISIDKLEDIMLELGCIDALNGDGGGSTYMWPYDTGWGRLMGSAILVDRGVDNVLIGDKKPELVIDPGHGGSDSGAKGNGIVEKELTLPISLYMFERFKVLGVPVAITRTTDISLEPADRAKLIRESKARFCISNHINASGGDGVETIHSIHSDGKLARAIAAGIVEAGQNLRRVFTRTMASNPKADYYFMHRDTGNISTVIVEYFFLDSKATGPDADLNEYQTELYDWVEGAIKGYCLYTGRKYTPPTPAQPDPPKPQDPQPNNFNDVPDNHYAARSIQKAAAVGVLTGIAPGTFGVGQPVTRDQLVVILDRLKLLDK